MNFRVSIQWTATAVKSLRTLPPKVKKGLLDKADELTECDPRKSCKPLTGPLQGYYRITYSRYRAIFFVEEEKIARGDVLLHLKVLFVAAGKRKEHDKHDIYAVATKLVQLAIDPEEAIEISEARAEMARKKGKKGKKKGPQG